MTRQSRTVQYRAQVSFPKHFSAHSSRAGCGIHADSFSAVFALLPFSRNARDFPVIEIASSNLTWAGAGWHPRHKWLEGPGHPEGD